MTHFEHLLFYIPNLGDRRLLDVGAGKGSFVIDAALHGAQIIGIEYNPDNVSKANLAVRDRGLLVEVQQGAAETLPFPDKSFGFLNFSEVIEHVLDPRSALDEAFRVLEIGGSAYVSVPSRFSWFDTHFHLAFVNWLPRSWSDAFIGLFGSHKHYDQASGHQRLSDMHYYTFSGFVHLAKAAGFAVVDMRYVKVQKRFQHPFVRALALCIYCALRPWYFRAFHFLLKK